MYQKFFDLKRRPFATTPDTTGYYPAPGHEETLALLKYCVREGDGIGVLVGAPGTGKTFLCHLLLDTLSPNQSPVFITNTHMSSVHSMLQAIAYDLTLPFEGMGEQELRLRLTDFLMERFANGGKTLFFVDEAQHLSIEQLEELRMLTNLEGRDDKAVQVLIAGQNKLLQTLDSPDMEAFRQRIAVVARLSAFDAEQTVEYIRAQINRAGGLADSVFTANAMSEICEHSQGIPRRINQLCHRALLLAYANESGTVDTPFVEAAAAQLLSLELKSQTTMSHHHTGSAESILQPVSKPESVRTMPAGATVVEVGAGMPRREASSRSDAVPTRRGEATMTETSEIDRHPASYHTSDRVDHPRGVSRLRQLYTR